MTRFAHRPIGRVAYAVICAGEAGRRRLSRPGVAGRVPAEDPVIVRAFEERL